MDSVAKARISLFGAWCGVAYVVLLFVGWFYIGGFYPTHSPSDSPEAIAAFFRENSFDIRVGMIVVMWGCAAFIPFAATLADFVARVEGRFGPLAISMCLAGFANAMFSFYPPIWWAINAFRPDYQSIELIYFINDAAWIQLIGALSLTMPMFVVVAVAALLDRSKAPIFPRWSGFLSIWVFVLLLPGQLLYFFKSGPFAWNGLIAFWVPASVFCGWFLVMFVIMRARLKRDLLQ